MGLLIIFQSINLTAQKLQLEIIIINMKLCQNMMHFSDLNPVKTEGSFDFLPLFGMKILSIYRMALQLALTTLESVAVMLNERKRESEQAAAFHAKLRNGGSKLGKSEHARVLLREDDVQQLEFNSFGQVCRSKPRRLLLLNDQVVCAAVSGDIFFQIFSMTHPIQFLINLKFSVHYFITTMCTRSCE